MPTQTRQPARKSSPATTVSTKVSDKTPIKTPKRSSRAKPALPEPIGTKQSQLITLLGSGASMAQLTALTGWQPHTVRGTISGVLRKKLGLTVECSSASGTRLYRIVAA